MASSTDDIIAAIERGFANASKGKVSKGENVNVNISSEEIEKTNSRVAGLRGEITKLQQDVKNATEGTVEHTEALAKLSAKQQEYTAQVRKTTEALEKNNKLWEKAKDSIVEMSSNINDVQSYARELERTGKVSADLSRVSIRLGDTLKVSGVGYEQMTEAVNSLVSGVSDYTMLSADMQKSLLSDAALFAEVGVSNEQYTQGLQSGIKGMGMTADTAADTMRDLRRTALAMQVPVGELTDDYVAQADKLAQLGDTAIPTFKEMARIQKVTGLEMGKLIQMTDKFDTFEGAAEQAGSLNAALGGNFVDSMSLMMEDDPAERFKMIRDAIEDSGVSLQDMGRKQKMFMANAAGFGDVSDFAAAMSGDLSALEKEAAGSDGTDAVKTLEDAATNIRSQTELAANAAKAIEPAYGTLAAKAMTVVDKFAPGLMNAAKDLAAWNQKQTEKVPDEIAAGFGMIEGAMELWEKFKEILANIQGIVVGIIAFPGKMVKAGKALWGFFGKTKTKIVDAFGWLTGKGKFANKLNLFEKIQFKGMQFAEFMGKLKGKVGSIFTKIKGFGSTAMKPISKLMTLGSKLGPMLGRGLKMMTKFGKTNPITIALAGMVEGFIKVKAAGGDLADYIGGGLIGAFGAFAELGDFLLGGFIGSIGRLFGVDLGDTGLLNIIGKGINKMIGGVEMGFQEAWEALDWGFIGETFEYMWNGVVDWVYDFLGIASPSQVFMDIGSSIMDGITSMLDADSLMAAAQMMVDALLFPFTSLGSLLMDLIGGAFDLVPDSIKSFMGFETDSTSDTATKLAGATTGGVTAKAGASAGNDNSDPYVINLSMNLDGKEIDKKVVNVVGGIAKQATL